MPKYFLGIDPGLKGGLALISNEEVIVTPIISQGGELNLRDIALFIAKHSSDIKHAVLEHVWALPKQGAASGFKFGKVFGMLEAILIIYQIPYSLVIPQKWQKEMFQGTASKESTKDRSIQVAQRLFPSVSLLATERSSVPHDGMADALMMAEYARRKHG